MTTLELILVIVCLFLLVCFGVTARLLYKMGLTVLRFEDTLETSLDIVDERIDSIQKILDVPLFSDSPEIKRIHTDMNVCRDALLNVVSSLTTNISELEENEEEKNN